MLRRDGFSSESSSTVPVDSINFGEAAGKPDCPTLSVTLTRGIGGLRDLFSNYPKAVSTFRGSISAATLDKCLEETDLQPQRERMLILYYLLEKYPGLDNTRTRALGNAVLVEGDKEKTLGILKSFAAKGNKRVALSEEETMWGDAHSYATSMSDLRFLSLIMTIPADKFLHNAAVECEKTAYGCLTTQLDSLATGISQQILLIQKEECNKQVQREVMNEEEKELKVSRIEFVRMIEDLCRNRSRSYVTCSSGVE